MRFGLLPFSYPRRNTRNSSGKNVFGCDHFGGGWRLLGEGGYRAICVIVFDEKDGGAAVVGVRPARCATTDVDPGVHDGCNVGKEDGLRGT
jgi:hypothetical protein